MVPTSSSLMNFGDAMAGDQQNARRGQLDRVAQSRIGRRLRLVYRHLVGEPIPDDQIDLLLALRWKEREQGGSAFKASGAPEA
jgi:Anti-sigma factor NepR